MRQRVSELEYLYEILNRIGKARGVPRLCELKRRDVPSLGLYFFFEPGENRTDTGTGLRVVRVGTHALTATSKSTLWNRLTQHRGPVKTGGGNHRGSVFRLLVGEAMQLRESTNLQTWGIGSNATSEVRAAEAEAEKRVTEYLSQMKVIAVDVPDRLDRSILESSAIGLLSNYRKVPLDAPSAEWLGRASSREKVRESGLWNNRDVDAKFDPFAFKILDRG